MRKTTLVAIILCGLAAVTSCKKDDHSDGSHQNTATITIASPVAGSVYGINDTVHIRAFVVGQQVLHGYEVHIRKVSDGLVAFSRDVHLDATSYDIREEFVNNVSEQHDMELEIVVVLDHEGNTASKKVVFRCNP